MNILIVEDETKTANALKKGLEDSGYTVDVAYDGLDGLAQFSGGKYQLIVSDIIMPGITGIELCKRIRAIHPSIPILLLTAIDSKDNVVTGLDAGADDYLTKPFDFRELLARIRRLLKRSAPHTEFIDILHFADIEVNLKLKQVTRAGTTVTLTAQEFKLLEYFMRKPNTVISRTDLARDIWNIDFETGTNIVEVYINYLRNKVDKPFGKKLIHNLHGIGYILKEN
ncbi:MAG TPA: response regulator transcription factor [Chitinophagales bacterium]|nr:response regulator transcription factor [Chitinophagales bacterium]